MTTCILDAFASRFQDFRKHQELMKFILYPLKCNLGLIDIKAFHGIFIAELKMEFLEIQKRSIWVQKH